MGWMHNHDIWIQDTISGSEGRLGTREIQQMTMTGFPDVLIGICLKESVPTWFINVDHHFPPVK